MRARARRVTCFRVADMAVNHQGGALLSTLLLAAALHALAAPALPEQPVLSSSSNETRSNTRLLDEQTEPAPARGIMGRMLGLLDYLKGNGAFLAQGGHRPPRPQPRPVPVRKVATPFRPVRMVDPYNILQYFESKWNTGTPDGIDCNHVIRVGPRGDGGKLVCADAMPSPGQPCRVVSVGLGSDFGFESDLHRHWPHCVIDMYDGTNWGRQYPVFPPYIKFHKENFNAGFAQRLKGGTPISLFKIDCEGCEFTAMEPFISQVCPEQFQVEVHGGGAYAGPSGYAKVDKLMRAFNRTHGVFYKEPNIQFTAGDCVEFAFRRREGACAALRGRG